MKFIVVAYFTKDTPYEKEIIGLKESLDKLNIPYDIKEISNLGSWNLNCNYKPIFIKNMLEKYKKRIIYVDADARFRNYPDIVNKFEDKYEIGVHFLNGVQLCAGTIFFNYKDSSFEILNKWIEKIKIINNHKHADQFPLELILKKSNYNIFKLPYEYYYIFDKKIGKPVIEHMQASRRFKNKIKKENDKIFIL